MSPRLRRSEWNVIRQILGGWTWFPRGDSGVWNRCLRRGLIEKVPDRPAYHALTDKGAAAYAAHPTNWGLLGCSANCHPGRVLQ